MTANSGFDIDYTREGLQRIEIYGSNFTIILLLDEVTSIESDTRCIYIKEELQVYLGLQNVEQHVHKFSNVQTCIAQLMGAFRRQSIILFISRNQPIDDVDCLRLCDLPNVEYVFHFGSDNPCRKMRGEVFTNVDQLLQVESDLHIIPVNLETTPIERFDVETKRTFIMQLLMELLQNVPCKENEKQIFIQFLKDMCLQDAIRLKAVREYEEKYSEKSALEIYTSDTCIHRCINKVCREQNPVSMIKCHYFIRRLYTELKDRHASQLSTKLKNPIQVYRGAPISVEELHRFQKAVDRFVLTNSFLSTSKNRAVALVNSGEGKRRDKVSVLFSMEIAAYDNPSRAMAFLDGCPHEDSENEVLLSSGMILRIKSVKKIGENMWEIELVRNVEGIEFEKRLYARLLGPIPPIASFLSIGSLLRTMNDHDVFNEYCNRMADLLQTINPQIARRLRELPGLSGQRVVNRRQNNRRCDCRHVVAITVIVVVVIIIIISIIVLSIVFAGNGSISIPGNHSIPSL